MKREDGDNRIMRMLPRRLALVVALTSAVACTALGATEAVASIATVGPGPQLRVVDASPAVDNRIRVSLLGADFVVEDETGVSAGVGCEAASAVRVICPQGDIGLVGVAAGGGDDEVEIENEDGAVPASMPTIVLGEDGSDTLLGGDGSDYIDGGPGLYDETNARGGDDSLPDAATFDLGLKDGGPGSDTVDRSAVTTDLVVSLPNLEALGNVTRVENVIGGQQGGRNILIGNADGNRLVGGRSHDVIVGGPGDDDIEGQGGIDQVALGEGDDYLGDVSGPRGINHYTLVYGPGGVSSEILSYSDYRGSDGPITLDLETGVAEGEGQDVIADGTDVLRVYMSSFDDVVKTTDAEAVVSLGAGDDQFDGGAGRDIVLPGLGSDELSGGSSPSGQADALSFEDAGLEPGPVPGVNASLTTGVATGHGHDTFEGFEALVGGAGFDVLEGSAGDDHLSAGAGGALMRGLDGADSVRGGSTASKLDIVDLSDRTEDLTVELPDYDELGVASGDDEDSLFNVDSVTTGSGNDNVTGNLRINDIETGPGDDVVAASAGADFVDGGPGTDILNGEGGADELIGGAGSDEVLGGSEGDLIRIRDGQGDSADCGDGDDTLVHDSLDDFDACETADPEGAPVVEITDGPAPGERVGVDATWSFSVSEPSATVECTVGTTTVECSGGTVVLDPSAWRDLDGPYTLSIRAEDFSGDLGSAGRDLVLDTTPPLAPKILARPEGNTRDTSATFEVEGEPGTTLRCSLDGGEPADCSSGSIQYEDLADGGHVFNVTAVDEVGLESHEVVSWRVDTVAPAAPSFSQSPPAVSTARGAKIRISPSEIPPARFSCSLDDAAYEECSLVVELSGLDDGEHTLKVRQHDFAGNASAPVAHTWVVDVASDQDPPAAPTITGAPTGTVSHRSVVIEFDGEPYGEFRCSIDWAPEAPCARDRLELEELADGTHTVRIRQVDDAGNAGPASTVEWTVDTVAPDAPTVASGPPAFTNDQTGRFALEGEPGASFRCSLDAGPFNPCDADVSFAGLNEGPHTLAVVQHDAAGYSSPEATHDWTVDLTPPAAPAIVAGPASPSPSRDAVIVFQGEAGASWECRLNGALRACPAGTLSVADLEDGSHTARARATDAAGNQSAAAEHSWRVAADLESVVTRKKRVGKRRYRVRFRHDGPAGVGFVCSLGSRRARACSSPYLTPRLKKGVHRLRIWARSAAGDLEERPSVVRLRIKRG